LDPHHPRRRAAPRADPAARAAQPNGEMARRAPGRGEPHVSRGARELHVLGELRRAGADGRQDRPGGAGRHPEATQVVSALRRWWSRMRATLVEWYGERATRDGRRSGGTMEIKRDRMVFLGYGKYWRSDTILGLMPIEEERGPKRRTNVFVEGRAEPIIASRTEQSILEDMGASDAGFQVPALREAVTELLAALHELSPVLRRTLQQEHHFDVETWEQRLGELL